MRPEYLQQTGCHTLYENLMHAENRSREVIHAIQNPVHKRAGIKILYGNIAPDGAVTKPSAIPEEAVHFCGKAKIYESEESALTGIRNGEVQGGEVVVIRNEGPKGGPGMPEMYKAMKLLVGLGLGSKVCLITDGRFSGSNNGCFVGHICPEAADDGAIAYLQDGDIHLESFVSSLLPFTAFTHLGLAMTTLISSSRRLKTGTQYLPVDSMQTLWQSLSRSHCLNSRIELLKVEKRFFW